MKLSLCLCFAASVLGAAGLMSCATDKETIPATPQATSNDPKLVGRIASIPQDKRFVLIQSYGKWNIAAGTILTTRGENERAANLLATGEVLGEFAAADIQSGLVEVGDAVYTLHVPKPDQLTPPEGASEATAGAIPKNN